MGALAVPATGRFDALQFRAVLELLAKQTLRPGLDASTGARGNPLRQMVLSLGLMGVMFSFNAGRFESLPPYLVLLFGVTVALDAFAINPETQDVMQRRLELLHSKPVGARTMSAARTAFLALLTAAFALPFSLAPLVVAVRWHGLHPLAAVAAAGALYLGCFSVSVLWLTAVGATLRWTTPERIRKVGQSLFLAAVLLLTALTLDLLPAARAAELLRPLPTSWFARLVLPASGLLDHAQRLGALALLALAGLLMWRGGLDLHRAEVLQSGWRSRKERVARGSVVGALERAAELPGLGRLLPDPVLAVAGAVLTLTRREEVSRLKVLAPRVIALGGFAAALAGVEPELVLNLLAYVGFSAAVDGLSVAGQSSTPAAGWVFRGAPLSSRDLMRGLRLAVSLRFLLLPAALLAVLLLRAHPWPLAVLLALDYLLAARVLLALAIVIQPVLPLSSEHRSMSPLWAFVVGFVATLAGGIAHAVVVIVAGASLTAAAIIAGMAAAMFGIASWALGIAAAARLDSLEHA